jgi:alpha-tubulin suppressor-like RCC1 family protein
MTASSVPVPVSGLASGVSALSAGDAFTCAVTAAGAATCWGDNTYGQLGNGTMTDSASGVAVSMLTAGVASISSGYRHTCAVTTGGAISCWGLNTYGELGNNSTTQSSVPVAVSQFGLGGASVSAAFGIFACALTTAGAARCWGDNTDGELGNNSQTESHVPVDVMGLSFGVNAIAAGGGHACALITNGSMECWGYNDWGELGNGSTANSLVPAGVSGLASGVTAIAAGGLHTCAVATGGAVKCWGGNLTGQLGDGTTTQRDVPVDVSGLASGVARVSAGNAHTCALTTAGAVLCWGSNLYGQIGDGTTDDHLRPVLVVEKP